MKFITALFSLIALVFYFSPWIYTAHITLGLYIIAFLWYMCAWLLLIVHIVLAIKLKLKNSPDWKYHLNVAICMIISYVGLFIGLYNGYMVTV